MAEWTLLLRANSAMEIQSTQSSLVVVDVEPQILLQFLVRPLSLAVRLWVVGCGGVVLDAQEPVKADRKLGLELGAPVMDYLLGDSMQSKNIIPQQPGCVLGIERGGSGDGMHLLGEPVNHDKDGILSLRFRQRANEVHGDGGPWP